MVLCRHYMFSKDYLNATCIEDYYQYLNEFYSQKEKDNKS